MRGAYDQFLALDTVAYGVNDGDRDSHQAFINQLGLSFDLLVDAGRATAQAYDAMKPDGSYIQRTVFIIGKDGKIHYREQGAPPPEDMLEFLAGIQDG